MQQPPPHPPYPQYEYEEDEINLLDYVIVLLKYKWLIFGIVFFSGIAAVIITLKMPNIYRSEATIMPRIEEKSKASSAISALGALRGVAGEFVGLGGGGDVEKFEVVLKSRELARRVVEKYKLMPELFEEQWDPLREKWKENPSPTLQDAFRKIRNMMRITRDRNSDVLTIQFEHEVPRFAKIMVDQYLTELSESLREETLKSARENKRFLREQLHRTSDILLKEKVYNLLAKEIENETFASAQQYYSFIVVDPPITPDQNKKVRPKRSLICILVVSVAIFFAIFCAFLIEYIRDLKDREKNEKFDDLKRYLKL